jgi:Holliday junction resolvase
MKEGLVTNTILKWLEANQWQIISYDFPQSGTGTVLRPHLEQKPSKNKGSFIPDVVAIKNGCCLFFENKDRLNFGDFGKINQIRTDGAYTHAIGILLKGRDVSQVFFGVCYATKATKEAQIPEEQLAKVDFVVEVYLDASIRVVKGEAYFN